MKMRRRTGVNGVRENHRDTVVNQGGTAESFGPLSGRKARLFYEKIQGRILPRRNKNREERRGEHYGKRKKTGRIHYRPHIIIRYDYSSFCTVVHRCGARSKIV